MTTHYVVAIGGSAGGVDALLELLKEFPANLDAPVVIALHSSEQSKLTDVLKTNSVLPVKKAENGDVLKKGCIFVAPGGKHIFFKNGGLQLSETVRHSGFRPSIDAMFTTLALEYQNAAIGVVLSGTLKDGMRGAQIIYDMGGQTIVQDPKDAQEAGMPNGVIFNDHPEVILAAAELGKWLGDKIGQSSD